jgi:hypothetical protein
VTEDHDRKRLRNTVLSLKVLANWNDMDNEIKKRKCCVPVCGGEKFDLVHKFPMQPDNAFKWKSIVSSVLPELNELSIDVIRKKYYVCIRHFKNEVFFFLYKKRTWHS